MVSLSPAQHFLAWTHGSHEGLCKGGCVLGARGGEDTFPCSLKDFCQEILDRRRMFIISDILKCRKLAGIFFPVPSAFNSSTLTPSTAKILSYPMRSSLNDSNDLFSIKPELPLVHVIVFWTSQHLICGHGGPSSFQSGIIIFLCIGLLPSRAWHTIYIYWI